MAKSKSFFGLRTGSTKTLTFQVLNGKQITKDRVEIVKNPRTQSQMAQRCLMATASAAYSAMRKIVNHSFQGYSYGQQNMSKFISENVFLLQNAVEIGATDYGYNPFRDRSFKPGAYMISKGTITPTVYTIETVVENGRMVVDLLDGQVTVNDSANEIAAILGLSLGEMTTICFIYGNNEDGWKFGFMRIRFVKSGSEPVQNMDGFYECFEVESSFEEIGYSAITTKLTFLLNDSEITSTDDVYFGSIYSRKSANGWLRSTSYITVPDGSELQPDYETALATYPQGTGYILNGSNFGKKVQPVPQVVLIPSKSYPIDLYGLDGFSIAVEGQLSMEEFLSSFDIAIVDRNGQSWTPVERTITNNQIQYWFNDTNYIAFIYDEQNSVINVNRANLDSAHYGYKLTDAYLT